MIVEKKFFSPKISLSSDLNKRAYIYWNEPQKGRIKKYGTINHGKTYDERLQRAKELVKHYELILTVQCNIVKEMYDWLEEKRLDWRKKTYQASKCKIGILQDFLNGRILSKQTIEEFFKFLKTERHKTTYNNYRQTIGQILNEIGYGEFMIDIAKVQSQKTPAKYFQKHQLERIKRHLLRDDPELWYFALFIYYCFLRPGTELRLLKVGDIDFENWLICVKAENAKNKKQEYVAVPKAFRPIVNLWKYNHPKDYVFPSKYDPLLPRRKDYMSKRFRKHLNELGFTREHKLYSMKHTGAIACVRGGVSVKDLQIQLRHHSLEQVDQYLRQLGVLDLKRLSDNFPAI